MEKSGKISSNRLLSLDFMRGLIMVLLALESSGFYDHLRDAISAPYSLEGKLIAQFFHNQWRGLHFWDLIQPSFMFIAGIAMTFSLRRQSAAGVSWRQRALKIFRRSALFLLLGLLKRISNANWLSLQALDPTDILTQLAFTTVIAFLCFDLRIKHQLLVCFGILLLTDTLYRYWSAAGFEQGYIDGHNFGNYLDWLFLNRKSHGYVFINWLPTAVHTVVGTVVGKILIRKLYSPKVLITTGVALVLTGYSLDHLGIIPIIKPIASSAFVLASLGYCMLMFTLCYWWIDLGKHTRHLMFFTVVGMNSIFIYLFFDIIGRQWLNGYVVMILSPVLLAVGLSHIALLAVASVCIFLFEWWICYFLYQKKIFFKL